MNNHYNMELLNYLKTRRSELALTLEGEAPSQKEIEEILTLASRVPDHGKLVPWRFVIYERDSRIDLGEKFTALIDKNQDEMDQKKQEKGVERFVKAPLVIGIISTASQHEKVPIWEQELCGGAVAYNCLIAAQALGYGAQWLTGWLCYHQEALKLLGVKGDEKIIGLMHIGKSDAQKHDRARPDVQAITTII